MAEIEHAVSKANCNEQLTGEKYGRKLQSGVNMQIEIDDRTALVLSANYTSICMTWKYRVASAFRTITGRAGKSKLAYGCDKILHGRCHEKSRYGDTLSTD